MNRTSSVTCVTVSRGSYPGLFGGLGFHNNEAALYRLIDRQHFNQILCKNYREMSPGFMRTFAGYDDWTTDAMDSFAEYYEQMQKQTDTPMYFAAAKGKLHFSDEERRAYCERVADNLEYLVKKKGVKHLRYYCFSNEMSQCGWGELMNDLPQFRTYHEMLYRAFQNRGLNIGLLATDASEYHNWNTVDWAIEHMSRITEDYCVHIYEREHDIYDLSFYDFFYGKCAEIVGKAIRNDGKRVILGEFGIQKNDTGHLGFGNGVVIDVNRYFLDSRERAYCGLMLAEMIFAAVNAGIFALAYWSYTDYPDPYSCAYSEPEGYAKAWGEAERFISGTTDVKYNKYGLTRWEDNGDCRPRELYWCLAPLVKFFKRNSKVLDIDCTDPMLRLCALQNRDGSITVGIVNRHKHPHRIRLAAPGLLLQPCRVYEYDPAHVPYNCFCDIQEPSAVLSAEDGGVSYELKPESLTLFTTDYREKSKPVYAEGVRFRQETLCWEPVCDPAHTYYRVYAAEKPDFLPTRENQVASTVACELPLVPDGRFYRVLSVDHSGNA